MCVSVYKFFGSWKWNIRDIHKLKLGNSVDSTPISSALFLNMYQHTTAHKKVLAFHGLLSMLIDLYS